MKKVEIIAEAGVNHNGKLMLAKRLALYAKKAGADYIKFQIFNGLKVAIIDGIITQFKLFSQHIIIINQLIFDLSRHFCDLLVRKLYTVSFIYYILLPLLRKQLTPLHESGDGLRFTLFQILVYNVRFYLLGNFLNFS